MLLTLTFSSTTFAFDEIASSCEFNHINYKQAVLFVNKLKTDLQNNNRQAIAAVATFPLTVNETTNTKGEEDTRHHTIKNKIQFLNEYDKILTPNMRLQIINDEEPIFCNYQGAMIAHGIIWFNTENEKTAFFVINLE
jgi:hypothetical protein